MTSAKGLGQKHAQCVHSTEEHNLFPVENFESAPGGMTPGVGVPWFHGLRPPERSP